MAGLEDYSGRYLYNTENQSYWDANQLDSDSNQIINPPRTLKLSDEGTVLPLISPRYLSFLFYHHSRCNFEEICRYRRASCQFNSRKFVVSSVRCSTTTMSGIYT